MGAVNIDDVRKSYGDMEVLHGITFDIEKGEFVILVGPSGCGKSTLLRMIAGLEGITSGTISIGGRVVNRVQPKDRDVAMVFQSYALYPHMTVAENMGFSLVLKGFDKTEIARRVNIAAESLGLLDYLKRLPRHLSGGQRQRVAMGRAIVRDPAVFLFDEPLSNLDAKLRTTMRTEIKQNHQRLRTTTVHVTHDQIEAMTMADRIVVMREGVVEQIGTPLDLYDKPANMFVASFIGSPSMNMITGKVEGDAFVTENGTSLQMNGALPDAVHGRPLSLGVRPEHFVIDEDGEKAEVITIEPTGSETQVVMRYAGAEIVGAFRERINLHPGETLGIRPIPSALHFFEQQSGDRIV